MQTYREALAALGQRRRVGMKLGLEKMAALAAALGHPERRLRFLHIAGTNGKGSTAAFCAAALRGRERQTGERTGLFTSPHLISIRERFQVDGAPISREAFTAALARVLAAAETLPPELGEPTFFELLTALALVHFAGEGVAWVVWETGLGGRLDSTNIVTPAIAVITGVALDHQEFLGDTIEAIAREKAGILKPGIPAVTAAQGPALDVIREVAAQIGAPLREIGPNTAQALEIEDGKQRARIDGQEYRLSLLGPHQARNAACAAAALAALLLDPPMAQGELAAAFANTEWPGRFQLLRENPPLIVDGAHNPEGIAAAVTAWKSLMGETKAHVIYGTLADKDAAAAARLLLPIASRITLVPPTSDRAADPAALAPLFTPIPTQTQPSLATLWPTLRQSPDPVLIIGSLVLAGDALRLHGGLDDEEGNFNELLSPR
jgi:dihydrofolate synthase/folylpolyglutamate synthase